MSEKQITEFERLDLGRMAYTIWNGMHYESKYPPYHLTQIYERLNELSEVVNVLIRERNDGDKHATNNGVKR